MERGEGGVGGERARGGEGGGGEGSVLLTIVTSGPPDTALLFLGGHTLSKNLKKPVSSPAENSLSVAIFPFPNFSIFVELKETRISLLSWPEEPGRHDMEA